MKMLQVKLSKENSNPFYGMPKTLELQQSLSKSVVVNQSVISNAFAECKTKEKREMFYSLLFSIGDITGRHHNIFGKNKVDSGGNGMRDNFRLIVDWMKKTDRKQYLKFLNAKLFNEFNCLDTLLANRVNTKPKTNKVVKHIKSYEQADIDHLAKFLVTLIKGKSPFDKMLVAKFLTRPRTSKRSGHKQLLAQTRESSNLKALLIQTVSDHMGWPYINHGKYMDFKGYYEWRKDYNQDLESVLFSSGKIKDLDEQEFLNWLGKQPAGARYRVKRRLFDAKGQIIEKWLKQAKWFQKWETFKVEAQSTQRVLEEKVRQGTASEDDKVQLVQAKKDAKVTVGANNFVSLFKEIVNGTVDKIKLQPFLDKILLAYNTLVFVDDSGSMNTLQSIGFSPRQFAAFIATICLSKNPDDQARNLVGLFSNTCRMFGNIDSIGTSANSLMTSKVKSVNKPLINPEDHFLDNLKTFKKFLDAKTTGNGTNISSIPKSLHQWVGGDSVKLEMLQQYPVWTLISDGNFNNLGSASSSLNDFFAKCVKYFGFKPYVIAIDVAYNTSQSVKTFSGIENFMYLPPNPAQIEQFLTNFKDMDIMDVYTPLLSLYRSNRYDLVRANVM